MLGSMVPTRPVAPRDLGYLTDPGKGEGILPPRPEFDTGYPRQRLDGQWRFAYSTTAVTALADPAGTDVDDSTWPEIAVPGHFQLQGYGRPWYTNVDYPFPVEPPQVPSQNPTGTYRHAFDLDGTLLPGDGDRVLLRFEGIDSTGLVWLNGTYLGRTVGSRLPAEYDVTDLVHAGANQLTVRVHQWCAASYLEDQDMWWLTGIFRSVRLERIPAGMPTDVRVTADFDPESRSGRLRVDSDVPVRVEQADLGISGHSGSTLTSTAQVRPWSAEDPHRYPVTLTSEVGSIELPVGFRRAEVVDGTFRINGVAVKLRGINRHEFHPDRGRALTVDDMLADVMIFKRHNVNAVRTSHYPPHPHFLDLCDEHGLYVVDECDLETHGFSAGNWVDNPSDEPIWSEAYLDRARRMVGRDWNHPSIVVWSLGNESGTGRNLAAMSGWIHSTDPSRPIHYEGDQATAYTDMWSQMYPPPIAVAAIADRAEPALDDGDRDRDRRGKPYLLCEYAHAMGNGPGTLLDYREILESSDRCMGAFVWEYIDHAIPTTDAAGVRIDGYGGDFGEPIHDGNFITDGLMFADRTPSPGMVEYAKVIEPIRLTRQGDGLEVHNTYAFADFTGNLCFRVEADGEVRTQDDLPVGPLPPGERIVVTPPALPELPEAATVAITVTATRDHAESGLLPPGHVVGTTQYLVAERPTLPTRLGAAASVRGSRVLLGPGVFDRGTGELIELAGEPVSGPRLDLWRAPTDNDRLGWTPDDRMLEQWMRAGYSRLSHRLAGFDVQGDHVEVTIRTAPRARRSGVLTRYRWTADQAGLTATISLEPQGDWPIAIPRLGFALELAREVDTVDWFGGDREAYADSRSGSIVGRYTASVDDLHTPYARPQENGQRLDVDWAMLTGPGARLRISGEPAFGLTVSRYSTKQLEETAHEGQLVPEDNVYVHVDLGQNGLGTASCGPGVQAAYQLRMRPATFTLHLAVD
jgi:beta-galactosidase